MDTPCLPDRGDWIARPGRPRFRQTTSDAAATAARGAANGPEAAMAEHDAALRRRLFADPDRNGLVALPRTGRGAG